MAFINGKILLAATIVLGLPSVSSARDLTVTSWGGTFQDAQRKAIFEPFTKETGKKLIEDSWDGGIGILRTKSEAGDGGWDVVQVESEELELGCSEGLFEEIDFDRAGGKDAYVAGAVSPCGVGSAIYNFVVAYDTTVFKDGPKNWADFFNLEKFPGKRALRQGPKGNLEIALMADGVAPADVYATLKTAEGVDRAFKSLDRIKPNLVFWKAGAQPMQLLASGEVAATSTYNGRVTTAINVDKKPFKLVWNESLQTTDSWVILANSPNKDAAYEFLDFASKGEYQAQIPSYQPIGVTSKAALELIDKKILADLPTAPENAANVLKIDDAFWIDNIDTLNARWTTWSAN
ncbi:ABC transporter substrate-binding protein [Brucella gallinifaecis]|uniref:ABC transporter substrate-binding protein n=1 Tax=Brucella gallinifaecis TaxID=215590 RepID=A0A502BJL9_9HYPH|nr:ABC transporter substrate-binding protein [Brucella gallinifaecis]TPF74692.1 ABC transporter substrate-binding protein [Brucella gallinifaecis]